jgi:hypothetical protein
MPLSRKTLLILDVLCSSMRARNRGVGRYALHLDILGRLNRRWL